MILAVHAAATCFMTGLIWFVQVVHYPLFDGVGAEGYPAYQRRHQNATTAVVLLPMLVELLTGALLLRRSPGAQTAAGLALLLVIWASTAFLQVPAHAALSRGFDARAHRRLVASNWLRTVCWTLRAVLVTRMLLEPSA